jgi:hypothetical protein
MCFWLNLLKFHRKKRLKRGCFFRFQFLKARINGCFGKMIDIKVNLFRKNNFFWKNTLDIIPIRVLSFKKSYLAPKSHWNTRKYDKMSYSFLV